jgi:ribose/xylose/arabinose/galactoside ABC-type transport system permease subunit
MGELGNGTGKRSFKAFLTKRLVWVILLILVIFAFAASPTFRKPMNLSNVLKQSVGLGIASLGQT